MKRRNKLLSMILPLAFAMAMLIGMTVTANAETVQNVPYLEASWNEGTKTVEYTSETASVCRKITGDGYTWGEAGKVSWYVASENVTVNSRVTVLGTVNLILSDGVTLTAADGITVEEEKTLNIYAQSEGENIGELNTKGSEIYGAAIGGCSDESDQGIHKHCGNVTIHGGKVTAYGDAGGAGIGGAKGGFKGGNGGNVTIYGGSVNANSVYGAGIGGSLGSEKGGFGGYVTIYGGSVNAKGIVGIGGWTLNTTYYYCGEVNINGGNVTADGDALGAGIGGGDGSVGANVTINGGEVKATGGGRAAGIGGGGTQNNGTGGNGGKVTINGGKVTATGGGPEDSYKYGAGIGGGYGDDGGGNGGEVLIEGGIVIATGGEGAAGIGGGYGSGGTGSGAGGKVTINGGMVTATGGGSEDSSKYGAGIGGGYGKVNPPEDNDTIALGAGVSLYGDENSTDKTRRATGPLDEYKGTRYQYMGTTYKKPQTIAAEDVEAAYGDTDKKVKAIVTDPATGGGAISYKVKEGSEEYIAIASDGVLTIKKIPSDGLAYVIATAAEITDYASGTKEVTINISKADPKVTAPKAKTLTYSGQAQELVTAGTTSAGTMQYALGTSSTTAPAGGWSTTIPKGTNAGTYYVWYKVVGDEYHKDKDPACVTVKIAEKPTPTPAPSNTARTVLVAKAIASGNTKAKVSWNDAGADRYVIYYAKCGRSLKKYKTVNGKTRSVTVSKLRKRSQYKFRVLAQKKSGKSYKTIATSAYAHMAAGNVCGRYTNVKDLKVNRSAVNLGKGRSFTIKTSLTKVKKNKRLFNLSHDPSVRFITSDPGVAAVSSKGKITAKGTGTCYIYVQAVNGIWKTVKVTVR